MVKKIKLYFTYNVLVSIFILAMILLSIFLNVNIHRSNKVINNIMNSSTYEISFKELNLPSGTIWAVSLNNAIETSNTSYIFFNETSGTYSFKVLPIQGYSPNPSTGNLTILNSPVKEIISFYKTYSLLFYESGLPKGYNWGVSIQNVTIYSASNVISFNLTNGTYLYKISTQYPYGTNPSQGSIVINGSSTIVSVQFEYLYKIIFNESGLPQNTVWGVSLNNENKSTNTESITYYESNGSYGYTLFPVNGYTTPSYNGYVHVSGSNQYINISWQVKKYPVIFMISNINSKSQWAVSINGIKNFSYSNEIIFYEPNGTYNYIIYPPNGYSAYPNSGTIKVYNGTTSLKIKITQIESTVNTQYNLLYIILTVIIVFFILLFFVYKVKKKEYFITFSQKGLPNDTKWYVKIGNQTKSSNSANIIIILQSGKYHYKINNVKLNNITYIPDPKEGTVTITKETKHIEVMFKPHNKKNEVKGKDT
ncbi:MAG: hypothetical protein ACP5UL_04065 [Thermoplasmata archaeon]